MMDETVLTAFIQAVRIMQQSGAKLEQIQVDRRTLDVLKFHISQLDIRRTEKDELANEPYSYVEIYGVPVICDFNKHSSIAEWDKDHPLYDGYGFLKRPQGGKAV